MSVCGAGRLQKQSRIMALFFKKNPPKAWSKCGRAEGWICLYNDPSAEAAYDQQTSAREQLSPGGYKSIDYTGSFSRRRQDRAFRYYCENCGYDRTYGRGPSRQGLRWPPEALLWEIRNDRGRRRFFALLSPRFFVRESFGAKVRIRYIHAPFLARRY